YPATPGISTLSLHDALPILDRGDLAGAESVEQFLPDLIDRDAVDRRLFAVDLHIHLRILDVEIAGDVAQSRDFRDLLAHLGRGPDRKSTRLNSSHVEISYAV